MARTHSPETRAKMSATRKGRTKSPEHRAALSVSKIGRPLTDEHRAAIGVAQKIRFQSPDERAKARAGSIGNRNVKDAPIKGECVYCFGPARGYDHVIPRGRPGWDDPGNVVPCCGSCNASKNKRTPEEWFEDRW